MTTHTVLRLTLAEWMAEGERRFGKDMMDWQFVCPSCGNLAKPEEFRRFEAAGATPNSVTCECIGRYTGAKGAFDASKHKPCNYAGYGLFALSPVRVIQSDGHETHAFGFADAPESVPPLSPESAQAEQHGQPKKKKDFQR